MAVALQAWGGLTSYSGSKELFWVVMAAARRLDTAHRQLERVREGIDKLETQPRRVRLREMEDVFTILGDAQLAVIALYRAAVTAQTIESLAPQLRARFPAVVRRRINALEQLRNAYEHVEDRAQGFVARGQMDKEKAWKAMSVLGEELRGSRKIRYRRWSIGVDKPATEMCVALRSYIRAAWLELCRADA